MEDLNTLFSDLVTAFLADGHGESDAKLCASDEMEDCGYVCRDGLWFEQ